MSFSVQLSSDLLSVEAGDNSPLNVQVLNRGEEVDRFEMEVEGLDPEWTAVPVPIFTVNAGESQTEKVFFKPPRTSESLAGNYPFVVKVRSINSGETRTAQGVLQIKPYNHLSMEIVPKKGAVSPIRSAEIFHASIINLGNTEQTLQIYGSDPEDAFAFEFETEQVNVGPGQQKDVEIRATATSKRPFSSPRLHVFTVSARSIQTPSLVASSQAQIEQRPIITPGTLAVAIFFLLVAFVWFLSRPQPPKVDSLVVDPPVANEGDLLTVRWHASNASTVELSINKQIYREQKTDGYLTFTAQESGTVTAVAVNDRTKSKPEERSFEVKQPVVAPPPQILNFDVKPRDLNVGQSIIVDYAVNDATTKVYLAPASTLLPTKLGTYQMKMEEPGTFKLYLVAENANGKSVKTKPITVKVREASQAHVVFFNVEPTTVDPSNPQVKITWQTTDAARVVLSVNGITENLPTLSGESTMTIDRDTDFQLTAYDSKGLTTRSQKITVDYKEPTPPSTTEGGATAGGTGNNNPQPVTTGGGG